MKKFFALAVILALVLTGCEQPTDTNEQEQTSTTTTLPSLTIKNESSFDLTDVKFAGISFTASGSNDLPRTTQSVKKLTANDINKTGYITFTRKDIGIICRTEALSITDQDLTFTFLDTTMVNEQGIANNRGTLAEITFLSQVAIERGGLSVAKNDTVNLGGTVMNTLKENEFTIKNTGTGKLLFNVNEPIKIDNDSTGVFSVIQPSNKEIVPNDFLTFKINFIPKAVQTYTATVTITSNDKNSPFTFTITAVGTPRKPIAAVFYEGEEISQYGTVNAGQEYITNSKSISVIIRNIGLEPLTVETASITITGADATVFNKTTNPGGSVSAGGQTSLSIECKPIKQGENNAVLTIPTNDGSRNPITIYLKIIGEKGTPVIELKQGANTITNNTLTPVDFGRVELGNSANLNFTIKNTGNINLVLTGTPVVSSSNSAFTVISQPTNTSLTPESSTSFSIQYTPTTEGAVNGIITIAYNSDNTPFIFAVIGTGYVKKPQIKIYYGDTEILQNGTIDVGDELFTLSKTITVTIKNTGEIPLTIDTANITITGTDSSAFTKTTNPNVNIQVGGSSTFNIKCEPVKVGQNNAIINIPSNDSLRNPAVVNLKVTGIQGYPVLALTQGTTTITNNSLTPVDFGTIEKGTGKSLNFTIKNNGNIALNLTGSPIVSSSNSAFTISSQPASTSLNPAATTAFSIQYTPTVGGTVTGTITIANNGEGAPFTFNVKGNGTIPAPTGVTAVYQSPGNIVVSWNSVSAATSYKVYYGTSSSAITSLASGAVTGTSYTHNGLSNGTTYYYNITAQDDGTESTRSQTVSMLTLSGIPGNLRSTASTYNSTSIAWDAVTGATSYKVYYAASAEGSKTLAGTVSSGTSYNHTSLAANTTRYYFVTAVNSTGEGSYTDALSVRTLLAPLSKPNNVTATALSTASIQVTWDAVVGATSYKIYRGTGTNSQGFLLDTVTTTSYTDTGLSAVTYWYVILALNADNVESPQSASASMIPKPNIPSNVKSSVRDYYIEVSLSWDSVPGAASYRVYYATSSTGTKTLAGTTTSRYYDHAGTANTTYYYWVTAVNAAGESDYSLQTPAVTTPPAAPMNLRATATTTTSITIVWDAVDGAEQYWVGGATAFALTGTSLTINGCTPQTKYSIFVRAINSAGLEGPSTSISVTTK